MRLGCYLLVDQQEHLTVATALRGIYNSSPPSPITLATSHVQLAAFGYRMMVTDLTGMAITDHTIS